MIIKDHKDNLNREVSLVEQKKMQWAKEREEMAKLEHYHSKLATRYERNTIRTQLITNTEIVHQNNNVQHQKNLGMRRVRSPSLPPIERFDKTMTRQGSNNSDQSSGYLSGSGGSSSLPVNANVIDAQRHYDYNYGQTRFESLNDNNQGNSNGLKKYSMASSMNEYPSSGSNEREIEFNNGEKPLTPSSESSITSQDIFSVSSYANSSTIDSSINYQKSRESGRAKWNSYLFDAFSKGDNSNNNNNNGRSSRSTANGGPNWLEKSLCEARDSEEETMSISVQSVSSFLRGQNIPVDPFVLAEREEKRRRAMELQEAIKQQLEERENIKKMEREKLYQQERLEEERLARQMEIERLRLEKEQHKQNEKLENERKKEEMMKKALEKAAMDAQKEKEKKRREKAFLQSSLDETISIQKIGEKTEIFLEEIVEKSPAKNVEIERVSTPVLKQPSPQPLTDEDDGETILIGTPIKLKKKNLDNFRKRTLYRRQNVESKPTTSDEEISTPKTTRSVDSNNNEKAQTPKALTDLEGIAIVLQTMPLVPFVPISNEMFGGFNQLNNLAFLMAAQNRMNSPNVMLPIISPKENTQMMNEKLDLSQFIIPPNNNNQSTITFQIQQVPSSDEKIKSVPPTPEVVENLNRSEELKEIEQQVIEEKAIVEIAPAIPHDGTFTKEETNTQDAFTSTAKEIKFIENDTVQENNKVKILTPKKYRNLTNGQSIGTQTESFMFCEYCTYQHHHHNRCSHSLMTTENAIPANGNCSSSLQPLENTSNNVVKSKEKKGSEDRPRPQWGVRNPPVKYLKASERDPFYGKIKKKRCLKKTNSDCSDKGEEGCTFKECPLVKTSPLLPKRCPKSNLESLCSLKTDRFGNVCLLDEPNFVLSEAFRRVQPRHDIYASSDTESSIELKHRSFFLPRNDFQDIFVD